MINLSVLSIFNLQFGAATCSKGFVKWLRIPQTIGLYRDQLKGGP